MTITVVTARYIAALYPFISNEATRPYLGGVFIEPASQGGAFLVATDSHRIGVAYDASAVCSESGIYPVSKELLAACKGKKTDQYERRVLFAEGKATVEGRSVNNADVAGVPEVTFGIALCKPIEGEFPDWRRAPPKERIDAGRDACFNAGYLADFAKVMKALGGPGSPTISVMPNGGSPALVRFDGHPEFFAALMPIAGSCNVWEQPGWLEGEAGV